MAIIKKKEMRTMPRQDMEKKMSDIKLELAKERASAFVGGSVKNPGKIREMRRTIARMKTHIKAQESGKSKG